MKTTLEDCSIRHEAAIMSSKQHLQKKLKNSDPVSRLRAQSRKAWEIKGWITDINFERNVSEGANDQVAEASFCEHLLLAIVAASLYSNSRPSWPTEVRTFCIAPAISLSMPLIIVSANVGRLPTLIMVACASLPRLRRSVDRSIGVKILCIPSTLQLDVTPSYQVGWAGLDGKEWVEHVLPVVAEGEKMSSAKGKWHCCSRTRVVMVWDINDAPPLHNLKIRSPILPSSSHRPHCSIIFSDLSGSSYPRPGSQSLPGALHHRCRAKQRQSSQTSFDFPIDWSCTHSRGRLEHHGPIVKTGIHTQNRLHEVECHRGRSALRLSWWIKSGCYLGICRRIDWHSRRVEDRRCSCCVDAVEI